MLLRGAGEGATLDKRWLLGAIVGVALVRGLFWVAIIEVPNPVDEIHHLGYIDSLAAGNGVPRVGEDRLPESMLELMRQSPTFGSRRLPLDPEQPQGWGATAHQYEGVQPPLYYAAMLPAFLAGAPWGLVGSLYAVRIASVLLALTAIPLAWLLARELFPGRPVLWSFSALLPALLQGFNSNLASATNDALVVPLATAVLLATARSSRRPDLRGAVVPGLLAGAAMLAKLNALALFPILGVGLLVLPGFRERTLRWRIGWGVVAGVVAAGVVAPWLAWNQYAYGTPGGGSEIAAELFGTMQTSVSYPFTPSGLLRHLTNSQSGFWQFQRFSPQGPGDYGWLFAGALTAALAGALIGVARRTGAGGPLAWLGSAWPLTFISMIAIVYLAYTGTVVGRHIYPALVPLLIFLAAGLIAGCGRRCGVLVLAVVVAGALWLEQAESRRYLDQSYLPHLVAAGVGPAWEQPFNHGWVAASGVRVRSPCPVAVLGLGIQEPPEEIPLSPGGVAELVAKTEDMALYSLDRPHRRSLNLSFPEPLMLGAGSRGGGRVLITGEGPGRTAMAQIQCRQSNPAESRFAERFDPYHLDLISYRGVLAYHRAWAAIGVLLALAVAASQLRRLPGWLRDRRGG